MMNRMVEYNIRDNERMEASEAKNTLQEYCAELKTKLTDKSMNISDKSRNDLVADCEQTEEWLDGVGVHDKSTYLKRKSDIENKFNAANANKKPRRAKNNK